MCSFGLKAQSPINITKEHAELGRRFADKVWLLSEGIVKSLPTRERPSGYNEVEQIKLTFKHPVSKQVFRSIVNLIVNNHIDIVNVAGGWTDENGTVMTFIVLNRFDQKQRAGCLVAYDERTGVAVFQTMSSNL